MNITAIVQLSVVCVGMLILLTIDLHDLRVLHGQHMG